MKRIGDMTAQDWNDAAIRRGQQTPGPLRVAPPRPNRDGSESAYDLANCKRCLDNGCRECR